MLFPSKQAAPGWLRAAPLWFMLLHLTMRSDLKYPAHAGWLHGTSLHGSTLKQKQDKQSKRLLHRSVTRSSKSCTLAPALNCTNPERGTCTWTAVLQQRIWGDSTGTKMWCCYQSLNSRSRHNPCCSCPALARSQLEYHDQFRASPTKYKKYNEDYLHNLEEVMHVFITIPIRN